MAICGGCGAETRRIHITMTDDRGRLLQEDKRKEICPSCVPDYFHDAFLAPVDRRLWFEHEAKPHLYHRRPDGFFELNDSPKADLINEWEKDPDAEAMEKAKARKRAQRRTRPLEPHEIEAADRVWRPIIAQQREDMKRQEEGDELHTQNLIEDLVRKEHDAQTIQ